MRERRCRAAARCDGSSLRERQTDRTAKGHAALLLAVPNGIIMDRWTPAAIGRGYPITPVLEPLAPFKDRMVVLSGLANNEARKLEFEIAGDHPRACSAYLTAAHPKMTSGADIHCGVGGPDCGEELGKHTQLPSLEIGLEMPMVGACESAYSCVYYNIAEWTGDAAADGKPAPRRVRTADRRQHRSPSARCASEKTAASSTSSLRISSD